MRLNKVPIEEVKVGKDLAEDAGAMYLIKRDGTLDVGEFYYTLGKVTFFPIAGDIYDDLPNQIWEIVDED